MSTTADMLILRDGGRLRGATTVPGDKSITHRALMLGALAAGESRVRGWLEAGDTLATLGAASALGVRCERNGAGELRIQGGELRAPQAPLDFANAGTGIRLMAGVMVGQPFASVLDGSAQLRRRPMGRVIAPLRLMGADIAGVENCAPLMVRPTSLQGIRYTLPIASAQVKSALLLAGLFARGETVLTQPAPTRDHSERMLRAAGVPLDIDGATVTIQGGAELRSLDFRVPGDFSSAAFLLVAALTLPGSELRLQGVNLNPTRTGLLDVLHAMGANIEVSDAGSEAGEPVGTLTARHSALRGIDVGGDTVVRMIDEFPALMVAALCAEGRTCVRDAAELRLKETDRLAVMTGELGKLGARIEECADGFVIEGPQQLRGAPVAGHDDHRVAMSLALASMLAAGETRLEGAACIGDSFPDFAGTLQALGGAVEPLAERPGRHG